MVAICVRSKARSLRRSVAGYEWISNGKSGGGKEVSVGVRGFNGGVLEGG